MPAILPQFRNNVAHVYYKGATIQIRRYGAEHFISINGDHYPYGLVYSSPKHALNAAKRRIDKADFETSALFLATGSHSIDDPSGWRPQTLLEQRCQCAITWRRVKSKVLYRSTLSRYTDKLREIWLATGIETYAEPQ